MTPVPFMSQITTCPVVSLRQRMSLGWSLLTSWVGAAFNADAGATKAKPAGMKLATQRHSGPRSRRISVLEFGIILFPSAYRDWARTLGARHVRCHVGKGHTLRAKLSPACCHFWNAIKTD